jgi:kynurenine formamidase
MPHAITCLAIAAALLAYLPWQLANADQAAKASRAPQAPATQNAKFVDLSLLIAPELPCTWPGRFPFFQLHRYRQLGPESAYNCDSLLLDPNTGTQMDVPPHSIPVPDSSLPNASPAGAMFPERVPPWQFCGQACVIDCTDLLSSARNGQSPMVTKDHVRAWESQNRPLEAGDVVLFRSGYSDTYYRPLPEGRRFIAEPAEGRAPAWPDPDVGCMEYLATRGVLLVGTDSPSMGPLPSELAEPTHVAGLKHGMIFTEGLTNLGELPATGAFYAMLAPNHIHTLGTEVRAVAVVGEPTAEKLIASAAKKQVVDLSVPLSPDLPLTWPGRGMGNHRQPFLKIPFEFNRNVGLPFTIHHLDSQAGTHLVPPAYALPAPSDPAPAYAPEVRGWLAEYERLFGPRGTSEITTDRVPLSQMSGLARVMDVRQLEKSTRSADWPASPKITPQMIQKFEQDSAPLEPGQILVFKCGWSDRYCQPGPAAAACMEDPINGRSEGWPAPTPEAIAYLAKCGIRCVATDAPTIGGVDPKQALWTYWLLGSRDMVAIEYLKNLDQLPEQAYLLFAPIKIHNCHGGYGRALALY